MGYFILSATAVTVVLVIYYLLDKHEPQNANKYPNYVYKKIGDFFRRFK